MHEEKSLDYSISQIEDLDRIVQKKALLIIRQQFKSEEFKLQKSQRQW